MKASQSLSLPDPSEYTLTLPTPGAFPSLVPPNLPEGHAVLCVFPCVLPSAQNARPARFVKQAQPMQPLRPSSNDTSPSKPSLPLPPSWGISNGSILCSPTSFPILPCWVTIYSFMVLSSLD